MGGRLKINLPNWFYVLLALYFIVRLGRAYFEFPYFIKNYFTDLICMPIILMVCLTGVRLIKKQSDLQLNFWHIAIVLAQFIFIFEIILPKQSMRYTGDWIDAVMYFIGAIVFYFLQQPKRIRELSN